MHTSVRLLIITLFTIPFLACGCDHSAAPATSPAGQPETLPSHAAPTTNPAGDVLPVGTLHNVHQLTRAIYCGSVPETTEDFAALKARGIKTIISVDGSKPPVELAEKAGLRYVHLPFGYDGIPPERQLEIERAVRDLPGPIYIHCHHGLHRGPAAAVIAAEASVGWTPNEAVAALQAMGTSPQYPGLYAAVKNFQPPTNAQLDRADASFPRIAHLDDLADVMVSIDDHWQHFEKAKKAGWPAATQPGIDLPAEAIVIMELFRESQRPAGPAAGRPEAFLKRLSGAESTAADLNRALTTNDRAAISAAALAMQNACAACHKEYRNPARKASPG